MTDRSRLIIDYRAFFTQKRGNDLRHYEDAFALDGVEHAVIEGVTELEGRSGSLDPQGKPWRCAVADGATQGGFSKLWAQMLVDNFIYHTDTTRGRPQLQPALKGVDTWLKQLSYQWNDKTIDKILSTVPANSPRRSRMQQTLLLEGQAATLAMLEIDPAEQRWRAGIIGDSLVFHYRGDALGNGEILPVRPAANLTWDQLDTNPILISSKENNQDAWVWNNGFFSADRMFTEAEFQPGDYFLLMTDALAKWFLRAIGSGGGQLYQEALHTLFTMQDNAAFVRWVEDCRSLPTDHPHYINNDDMTLVLVSPLHDSGQAAARPVQAMPVREVPAAKVQTQEVQAAPPQPAPVETVAVEAESPQATVIETEDEEEDPFAANRQVTRMARGAEMSGLPPQTVQQPDVQSTLPAAPPPIPDTLPEQTPPVSPAPAVNEVQKPAFQQIEAQFDDTPLIMAANWVDQIIEQIFVPGMTDRKLRQIIAKEYDKHLPVLDEWSKRSSRRREIKNSLRDFYREHIDLEQFKAFCMLSEIRSKVRDVLRNKSGKMQDREQKKQIQTYGRAITEISHEYRQQWCDRNTKENRSYFLQYMKDFHNTGNWDDLRKLLH